MAEKMLKDLPEITEITNSHQVMSWNGNNAAGRISIPNLAAKLGGIVEQSLQDNGYVKFASGLIIQWGKFEIQTVNSRQVNAFPITFPTMCFTCVASATRDGRFVGVSAYGDRWSCIAQASELVSAKYIAIGM